jgi:pimeloyl-ACP methyl ester carboxylesterase
MTITTTRLTLGALAAPLIAVLGACDASQPPSGAFAPPPPACGLPAAPATTQAETPCADRADARLAAMSDAGIGLASELGLPPGRYALPATATPTQLVVMFHGHQNDSCSWRNHLREVAARGAVAVAMDYTGQVDRDVDGFGFIENWGWFVRSGAADSITAARYFMDRYPSITQVFNFGASMGGNVSGYAAYSPDAVRADCSALWDWWIATEGVHNLSEEYTGARTLAPGNATAAQAQLEIEQENGGSIEAVPDRYAEITTVAHVDALAYLKGVVLSHGSTDQTVPFDQSRQVAAGLRGQGVPVHFYQVTPSDHAWEGDGSLQVMKTGLDALYALMAGGTVADGDEIVAGP